MTEKKWTSNAEWPRGTFFSADGWQVTRDLHYTNGEAKAVCAALQRGGFAGQGVIFPLKTWFERVKP